MANNNKKIVVLNDYEHVRKRPEMYASSVSQAEERVPVIKNNRIVSEVKPISAALYKLFNEILDNSFDALKRDKITNGTIKVHVGKDNRVTISDNAHGFHEPDKINDKTGVTNVETAVTALRAGSNFYNDDTEEALIGTNGVGSAIVNILSKDFSIRTANQDVVYFQKWVNFETKERTSQKNTSGETGTEVSFLPDVEIFKEANYDLDILTSQMVFRNYLLKKDPAMKDTKMVFFFDEMEINLDVDFLPEKRFTVETKTGEVIVYPTFSGGTSVSFINGTQCTGMHQKIIQEIINDKIFKVSNAHHFYETVVILNLPPKLVKFQDQNKTRYSVSRNEIEPVLLKYFEKPFKKQFPGTDVYDEIFKAIEESSRANDLRKINSKKREAKKKVSDKYFPASQSNDSIYLCEGDSAAGSVLQKIDRKTEAVYALKGKIKNTRRLADLSTNNEIIDLITILGLDVEKKSGCNFKNVIIATDADPDGGHISSLIINFFYKWFPHIIEERRLNILIVPLLSAEVDGKIKYFHSMDDFHKVENNAKNVRYLKGLGSMNLKDWDVVMKEKKTLLVRLCTRTERSLRIAFGENANARKKWLSS